MCGGGGLVGISKVNFINASLVFSIWWAVSQNCLLHVHIYLGFYVLYLYII